MGTWTSEALPVLASCSSVAVKIAFAIGVVSGALDTPSVEG